MIYDIADFRPVPTRPIYCRLTPIDSRFPSSASSAFTTLNMFERGRWPTITESVVQSADSAVESADSTADSSSDLARIGVWVWALSQLSNIKHA